MNSCKLDILTNVNLDNSKALLIYSKPTEIGVQITLYCQGSKVVQPLIPYYIFNQYEGNEFFHESIIPDSYLNGLHE